jgi:hypothetical protein
MKESLKTVKKHFIESFEEFFESIRKIFTTPNLIERFCVWVMVIFTVAFGTAALVIPILLHTNYDVSGFVFLSLIVTVPIEVVLIGAVANWIVKVYQE